MMQNVRGTQDILPQEMERFRCIVDLARVQALLYGFQEISTPLLEFRNLFDHSAGQTSDIVSKEMYEVAPRAGKEGDPVVVLRPEGTASVVRAILSNGLVQSMPCKLFYHGPMFRYGRPQKGRLRQFHQIGLEHLGQADPWVDVELLNSAVQFLKSLGVFQDVTLELNTLGDANSRAQYREALIAYFEPHQKHLSQTSQERLYKNPLRILESKSTTDQEIVKDAPVVQDFLTTQSVEFFQEVEAALRTLGIPYVHNSRLVRGLDYYEHTTFEFTTSKLGAQGTVLAGGRYDGLFPLLGGPQIPGAGWAAGIERLLMLSSCAPQTLAPVGLVAADETCVWEGLKLAHTLRDQGFPVTMLGAENLGKHLKKAHQRQYDAVIILGETEKQAGHVAVKNLHSGQQENVSHADLPAVLMQIRQDSLNK